tara:strand:+ start:1612 stop:2073 length:462 start_codon:yes stop_codon:yes gene_type:complete
MYHKIQHPITGEWVDTTGKEGQMILSNYLRQTGGSNELVQNKKITTLNKNTFDKFVVGPHLKLVGFFANWCGHCKNMQNDWSKASDIITKTNNTVKVAMVDSSLDIIDPTALSKQYHVKGFPSIKLFKDGSEIAEYQGDRTAKDIVEFVHKHS